jgi:hypothetical protein
MVNYILTKGKFFYRMYLTDNKQDVITETIIQDKRSVKYFKDQLLPKQ